MSNARPPELLALELLIGELLKEAVPLGEMRRAVLHVRGLMSEIAAGLTQPDDTAPALLLVASRELAKLAIPGQDGDEGG